MLNLLTILLFVPAFIFDGKVIQLLWKWHIYPYFEVSQLGLVQAMGLSLVIHVLTRQEKIMTEDENMPFRMLVNGVLSNLVALGIGFALSFFV